MGRLRSSFASIGRVSLALGLGLLLSQLPALSQSSTGTLTGVVTDQQGAALVGANIVVVDASTSSRRTAVANEVGRYTIVNIPNGVYDVTVTKEGFSASRLTAQRVEIGQELKLDVSLTIGATNTVVEVKATAGADLQTLNATIGATISNEALNLLPNLGRDASTLSVLQVGVSLSGNVAGAATDQNKYQLDGGNNSDDMAGTNTTYTPGNGFSGAGATGGTPTGVMPTPIESIEEVKIGTVGQGADFNGAAGSSVQMSTKRGTNAFHGAVYEYYFGSNVGAANLWRNNHVLTNGQATPLAATHRNRYGVAVGGPMTPKFWGGKTYFFFNYEASRFPNVVSFEKGSPTALMRAGVIKLNNVAYNLNPTPVTVNGTTYAPAQCGAGNCDPRNLGLNPVVKRLWDLMPLPNDPSFTAGSATAGLVDGVNAQGFLGNLALPQKADGFVGRIDHDFGDKWKFFGSYRYYNFVQNVSTQVDVGGLLGGKAGSYYSTATRPQKPGYWVTGLTGSITPNLTNDVRFSYLRNFWQWYTKSGPPQFAGLGGAVEIGGESLAGSLIPYNVDSQDVRQRFWDGHDYYLSDSLSYLKGKHFFQFGGTYQRNFDFHGRDDNGVGINTSAVYHVNSNSGINLSSYPTPAGLPTSSLNNYASMYAEVLGMVGQTQIMYSRSGKDLALNPIGTPGFDQSVLPSYDVFFNDTWRVKPSLTLSYGVSWGLAMPPYEINGKQVQMVDLAGNPIDIKSYLTNRVTSGLKGEVYNPTIGFATIGNAAGGQNKYPYKPFYGGFSPHVSVAWNPKANSGLMGAIFGNNETVIRGGYGRTYGRLNGVDLLLVPLLGPGLLQAVSCFGPTISGGTCGVNNSTPLTAFRIGTDGNVAPLPTVTKNLPQPFFPGITQNGILNGAAADGSQLDPNLRPNHSDNFTFSIQRSYKGKLLVEAGYIGRIIKNEFQEINPNAVPWMTTLNGQSFAQAYSAIWSTVNAGGVPTAQPFFEAALGGPSSAYCTGSPSCTAALASKQASNIKTTAVYNLWNAMNAAPGWTLGRTMMDTTSLGNAANINAQLSGAFDFITSYGRSNYNAAFLSVTAKDWKGLTARSNFTWGRALGTGSVTQASSSITVPNPYDFNTFGTYGTQPFDVKFTYSLLMFYQSPFFKSQKGVLGKALGGWTIAPLFTARTGLPQRISVGGNAQAFGEIYSGQSSNFENAAGVSPYTGNGQANYNVTSSGTVGSGGNPATGGTGVNLFADPQAVYNQFRRPILGTDFNSGGAGVIRGFGFWNLDATVSKDFKATEKIGATLTFQFVNVLNHFVPADPGTNLDTTSTFGVVTNQFTTPNGAQSRAIEFGLRVRF